MSSLTRRMQRMSTRKKFRDRLDARKYLGYLRRRDKFGSKLGLTVNRIERIAVDKESAKG